MSLEYDKYKDKFDFDEEKHEYKYNGVILKSVTSLLDSYKTDIRVIQ